MCCSISLNQPLIEQQYMLLGPLGNTFKALIPG